MKIAVKVELVSLVLFLTAFASLYYSTPAANILLWASLGLSYLCFLVEFIPKYKAHKIVALEHGTFGFLFYLLTVPIIYLSNYVIGWPDPQSIIAITVMLLSPVVVSKMVVIFTSLRRFDEINLFWFVALLSVVFSSNELTYLTILFCVTIFISTTVLLRSHEYFGFKHWVSLSTSIFLWSTLVGVLMVVSKDIITSGLASIIVFTMIFLFESVLSVRYRAVKDKAVGKLLKHRQFSKLAEIINHRYNLSLTLLAYDLTVEKRNISALGIVESK
jgi:hypothetical protein